ncbi:AAA family ATPase [Streptomyces orinoci]|uniref:AAA family ATPase n=1 Tax=Streptomyces orinoci TaxID=67339 RepID=A0ABV3JRK4_STRON|nr:AAA family ATPase [Streptomyces orinoci]
MDGGSSGGAGRVVNNSVAGDASVYGPLVQADRIDSLTFAAPPQPVIPRQLPSPRPHFVNREREFAQLNAGIAEQAADGRPGVIVVTGLGGVGKTELVAEWFRRDLADRYPDGQLYVDLTEFRRDGGVDVGAVLGSFLRDLQVDDRVIPATLGERTRMFRSVTAGRSLLVVIDNAQQAAEVRPMLAGRGLTVVLSRTRLASLEVDGAIPVRVDPLDHAAGAQLLRHWRASEADSTDGERLIELCGGLPLALRAAGRRLIQRPHVSLASMVRELADDRPRSGGPGGNPAVPVIEAVVGAFPRHTRRLYRFLGTFPGTTFTPELARAAGIERFDDALEDLLTAHLAVDTRRPGRFRLHDVAAAHARQEAGTRPEEELRQARRRTTDYYLAAAAAADRAVMGERFRLQQAPEHAPRFQGSAQALDWLDDERANLLAVLRGAAGQGWHDAVWRLCESLWALYHNRKHYADWIESHRLGIEAAQWEGRPDAEVRMRNQLARAHYELGDYHLAEEQLRPAEELLGSVTDPRLPGVIWETTGLLSLARGEPEAAIGLFRRSLAANQGDPHGIVVQSYHLAQALLAARRPREAGEVLAGAMDLARTHKDEAMQVRVSLVRARVYQALGEDQRALRAATDAALLGRHLGHHLKVDQALRLTAEIGERLRVPQVQQASRRKSRELWQSLGLLDPVA